MKEAPNMEEWLLEDGIQTIPGEITGITQDIERSMWLMINSKKGDQPILSVFNGCKLYDITNQIPGLSLNYNFVF